MVADPHPFKANPDPDPVFLNTFGPGSGSMAKFFCIISIIKVYKKGLLDTGVFLNADPDLRLLS